AGVAAGGELAGAPAPGGWSPPSPPRRARLARLLQTESAVNLTAPSVPETEPEAPPHAGPDDPTAVRGRRQTVGRYELLDKLGQGGMGVVYRARDPVMGREVALKMIRGGVPAGPEALVRFKREVQATAALQHPNIVPVYDVSEHEGAPFFTMPYLAGGSLDRQARSLAGDARRAVELVEKVARAVQATHERGIVHRDLKPSNVLLDERGEPLVADFGLAKFADDREGLTRTEQPMGTPACMTPEQAAGRARQATPQNDVWSLGVILYELLTGRNPFSGGDPERVKQRVLTADPPRPRALQPKLARDLETVVLRCLEKEPAR